MFSPLEHSIVGKAREKGLLDIQYHNFRENAEKARHVDDELRRRSGDVAPSPTHFRCL
ncbi:tRNA (guanine-N(1)-)-methyltransferase [Streptococcus mitis 11/5]|uniref:tRNA (Guanine-N(1)-)-methyltransferase n=1 Tax=Streptococcus mitis 11/5 TaxID=1239792 RepID=R0LI79_STRMT|nr:tRNA (guanine-N(1)-)-methyltransferase [Streptococcus mitis 11/5]